MTMPPEQSRDPQFGQGQHGQGQYGQGQPQYGGQPRYGQGQPGQPPYGSQPQYGQRQFGGQPYTTQARPPAPPLEPQHKRGSFIAGAVSLNLVNLGGTMLLAAIILGVVLAFLSAVLTAAAREGNDLRIDPQARAFLELVESINAPAWLLGGGLLGLVILVLGIFTSFWILRAHGIVRPWAVTWSAVGVSIPALVIVTSVLSVLGQVVGTLSLSSLFPAPGAAVPDATAVGLGTGIALVVVSFVVSLVVVAVVGALIWWWMAHVLRRPRPTSSAPAG
jgi:hypothetical protein